MRPALSKHPRCSHVREDGTRCWSDSTRTGKCPAHSGPRAYVHRGTLAQRRNEISIAKGGGA